MAATSAPEPSMARPPYDPSLRPKLDALDLSLFSSIDRIRAVSSAFTAESVLAGVPHMQHKEYTIPSLDAPVTLSVFSPKLAVTSNTTKRPAVYIIHGGGQIAGNRFSALDSIIRFFADVPDIVAISVEYRLAPEHPAPAALNDGYAGLVWIADPANAAELGIDPARIVVMGGSGGGPIAAGCALLARNNHRPKLLGQMLLTPMLDDRGTTVSARQFENVGPWCGVTNQMAWDCVLGREGTADERDLEAQANAQVDHLVAPARATDPAGLPPTFIDAGEAEVFRDEAVTYASRLWACGVSTELHVWKGAWHGFEMAMPGVEEGKEAAVAKVSIAAKKSWIRRVFEVEE
ncbi:Alpha/Beta hydrolase protein [Aspergillus pseudoustus]|uniref:Alpha/Beta hydrolase protein n=1 Tax=Aspergillus pseudoustus TaxID=1810923 RepID=A0ABR4JHY0_9EURO